MSDAEVGMWVTVSRSRILERFSSAELVKEVANRSGKALLEDKERDQVDALSRAITEAIERLQSGRADDALLTLERTAYPKFKTFDHSVAAYLSQAKR